MLDYGIVFACILVFAMVLEVLRRIGWLNLDFGKTDRGCPAPDCQAKLEDMIREAIVVRSTRTSGAFHISEEALEKLTKVEGQLKTEFLTKEKHDDVCRGNILELKIELKDHMDTRFGEMEQKLLKAIKGVNGS